jgi:hypothetical protein
MERIACPCKIVHQLTDHVFRMRKDTSIIPCSALISRSLQYSPQGSVQSKQSAKLFLQPSELELPHPLTRRRVCTPPPLGSGGAYSLARGGWGSPNSDEVTALVVLWVYMYFVGFCLPHPLLSSLRRQLVITMGT